MPAGTWNLGRLRKRVDYVGVKDLGTIRIRDNSPFSDQFFNITDFPTTLTGGKNLFKIKASANTLVRNSKIHIEILDSNGNPIYYEPVQYLEQDGTRVIAVYLYPDTPFGVATVYVAGRARVDPNSGRILRSSQDVQDRDYLNYPNVLWQRTVTCAPERFNSTEIIFTQRPTVTLRERIEPYLVIENLTNVATHSVGCGRYNINPMPQATSTSTFTSVTSVIGLAGDYATKSVLQGGFAKGTPKLSSFTTFVEVNSTISKALSAGGGNVFSNATSLAGDKGSDVVSTFIDEQSETNIIYATNESRFTTDCDFFTADMASGDVIKVVEPTVTPDSAGAKIGGNHNLLVPYNQANNGGFGDGTLSNNGAGVTNDLSGSYYLAISQIISSTEARVIMINQPQSFAHPSDFDPAGKFQVKLNALGGKIAGNLGFVVPPSQYVDVAAGANFTASYTANFATSTSEQSQSFAEITLGNLEPATGDVYKVKTFYKPGGAFGDFTDLGETVIEQFEVLTDSGSTETTALIGATARRMGFFTSLGEFHNYWTASLSTTATGPILPSNPLTPDFLPNDLMSGIRLQPEVNFSSARTFGYIHLKDEYRPFLSAGTQYVLSLNAFADTSTTTSDPQVAAAQLPRMDIYISGSDENSVIAADELTLDAYAATEPANIYAPLDNTNVQVLTLNTGANPASQAVDMQTGGDFGTRVGTILLPESGSNFGMAFRFQNGIFDQKADVYLVVRNGRFTISNVSIKTFNESKFTPNFMRFQKRIPSQFLNIPLTFKLQFLDFLNNQAETEIFIYPVLFTGENTLIAGPNNLLTGSVFVGNSIGAGIEISGQNSGFIRSVGYAGFNSASRTDQPGGFLMYTGSVLPNLPDQYQGVGIELVEHSESFLRFATDTVSGKAPGLDVRTPKFFLGGNSNFISGSNGNIEISSSNFHLQNDGDVIMQGTITAEAGGTIGGFTIGDSAIFKDDIVRISSSLNTNDPASFISSSAFKVSAGGNITGSDIRLDGGRIGGFEIDGNRLLSTTAPGEGDLTVNRRSLQIYATPTFKAVRVQTTGSATLPRIEMFYSADSNFGFRAIDADGTTPIFLGKSGNVSSNTIAGWTIDGEKFSGGQMVIKKSGTIESLGFASNVAGSGFRLTADQGGFLEVENARIRGTLSTATFEKESVNAVGGQLYVANSTVLTGSSVAPGGIHSSTTTTMSVENVTGFAQNEILTAKKVSPTGFATEYILVESASRTNSSSDTDLSGLLFVQRGYSGSTTIGSTSGSLGDLPSAAQSYSGSQVIVSTGKIGTGYIRLNANPNDPTTPFIDIIERTGSNIYDIELKARLGDLSGIADNINGTAVSGFGLYTDNAFLKGGIVATYGSIGGFTITSDELSGNNFSISTSDKRITLGTSNDVFIADADSGIQLGHATFASAPFSVTPGGVLKAESGTVGGFTLGNSTLTTAGVRIGNNTELLFISSSKFKVDHNGNMTASNALFDSVTIQGNTTGSNAFFQNVTVAGNISNVITVTAANSSSFFSNVGSARVNFLADGSGGGGIASTYIIDTPPFNTNAQLPKPIDDILMPLAGAGNQVSVTLIISTGSVELSGATMGTIGNGMGSSKSGTSFNLNEGQSYTFTKNAGGITTFMGGSDTDASNVMIFNIVSGSVFSGSFVGDGSGLSGTGGGGGSADNLGNHTMTQDLDADDNCIFDLRCITGSTVNSSGRTPELEILANVTVDGSFRALGSDITMESGSIIMSGDISGSASSTGSFAHIITDGDTIEFINRGTKLGQLKVSDADGFSFDAEGGGSRKKARMGDLIVNSAVSAGVVSGSFFRGDNIGQIIDNMVYLTPIDFFSYDSTANIGTITARGRGILDNGRRALCRADFIVPSGYEAKHVLAYGNNSRDVINVYKFTFGTLTNTIVVSGGTVNTTANFSSAATAGERVVVEWQSSGGSELYGAQVTLLPT